MSAPIDSSEGEEVYDEQLREPARKGLLFRLVRDQRVAFLLVGAVNTAIGFAFFVFFDVTVGDHLDETVNKVVGSLVTLGCAHVLSVICAFILHRTFVFKVRGHVWRDLMRFEAVYLVSITINAIVLPIMVQLGVERILAQFSILVVTTLISYFGHKYFSFRRPTGTEPTEQAKDSESDG